MPLLFLNEKSCNTDCEPRRAGRAMTEFIRAVLAVSKADRPGTVLVSADDLKNLMIAEGYPVGKWLGEPRNKDIWQRLLLALTKARMKAPFSAVPEADSPGVEYRHEGASARGLGGAHLMDALAVSLPVHAHWDTPRVRIEREQLAETAEGTVEVRTDEVEVRHLSAERHLDDHLEWVKDGSKSALRRLITGADIWAAGPELFPHLQFLPGVESHLTRLDYHWVGPVRSRLAELEQAVAGWNPDTDSTGPVWLSWVTPEHEQRKLLCRFEDWDGETRVFDIHARFTPKEGRVYFRLVPEKNAIRIAHIGLKLGI